MLSKRMKVLKDKLWKAVKKETPLSDAETTEAVAAIYNDPHNLDHTNHKI